ncbi:MAG TPA: TonB-dependent receptor [Bryobacteraceae bacterium]|nr:TonB-dependent receptor [Bryobacteraceae bacterium]
MFTVSTWRGSAAGVILTILMGLTAGEPAAAQVLYGSITGNVFDPSNAPIPGATVVITHKETGQTRQTVTNDAGFYNIPTVASGTYEVRVTKEGFQPATRSDVPVTINSVARVDLTLAIGGVVESVQVTASAALLQTDRAEVRQEITTKALTDLPVPPGRNYQQLFRNIPGFNPPENAHSVPSNPSRSLRYNVNGASASSNDVRVDGASQFNVWLPHITAYVPSLEAIETVNVVTNNFDAEQGLAGGSAVNVQIKSGTNEMHGSAFEYHNNNHTKARPFFLPSNQGKPKWVYNQFGGTLGGPIIRNKVFYFGSFESTFDRQFAARTGLTVPTADMRRGDLSASPNPVFDPLSSSDPATRTPFTGNLIPQERIHPISRKILNMWPLPNVPGDLTNDNFVATAPFRNDRYTGDGKINWTASEKLSMYARVSVLRYEMFNKESFGEWGGPEVNSSAANPGTGFGGTYSGTIAATYVVTPNFIIDGNYGYTLMDTNVEQGRLDEKLGLEFLGLPGTNGPRRFEGGMPRISVSSYANIGIDKDYMPYYRHDPQHHWVANANWTKGSHNIRFGFDIARQSMNHTQPEFDGAAHGAQGGFTFGNGPTLRRGGPSGNQWNSFGTFLLGLPTNIGRILQVPDTYTTRTSMQSLFVRDQWQVNHKLTLSLGTRWEYFPVPSREDRGIERYDFANNKMLICGVGQVPEDCGVKVSKRLFAPRLGFAWRATESWVVRGGYGITIDPFNLARPLRTNHPLLVALNIAPIDTSYGWTSRFEQGIPAIPTPSLGNGIIDVPNAVAVNAPYENHRRGYVQSWNFVVQKQIAPSWSAEAGYVATRQTKQLGFLDLNAGQIPGAGRNGQPYFARYGRTAQTKAVQPIGTSKYNSLQTRLTHRFASGFQTSVAYTFSSAVGLANVNNSDDEPRIKAVAFYNLNRARQNIDRPHNFSTSFLAELPFGKGRKWATNGLARAIAGGWQVNGLLSMYSGSPFSVTADGAGLAMPRNDQRADLIKPQVKKLGGTGRGQAFYDWTAFAPVPSSEARFGTAGYNILRGPGLVNLDMGVFREFTFTERVSMQFRAEGFNVSNTPHFSDPSGNISNLRLYPDGTFRSGVFEVAGVRNTGREGVDERVFRFGLRFGF